MESGTAVPLPLYAPSLYTMLNRFATIRIPIFWMGFISLKAFLTDDLISPGWGLFVLTILFPNHRHPGCPIERSRLP